MVQLFLPWDIDVIMIFREATSDDWTAISEISRRSGYEDYINRLGPAYLDEGVVLIAEEESPVGFSKVEMMPDGATWLSGLRVDPDHWRKGIGTHLTRVGIEKSKSMRAYAARMLVEEENYRSRALSEKMNFRDSGKYRFYENGMDLSGYEEVEFKEAVYFAAGWKFIRRERTSDIPGKFFSNGKNIVFSSEERNAFHVIAANDPLRPVDDGMTVGSIDMDEKYFSSFRTMGDFPTGIVYEMTL